MSINYNKSPYYDDYDESKKFLRILFRPGRAVQARELTQLQTLLQKQIARGAAHLFKDGSVVLGGSQVFDKNVQFLAIGSVAKDGTNINIDNFKGKSIRNEGNTVVATVRAISKREFQGDPDTLFISYDKGGDNEFDPNQEIIAFDPTGNDLTVYSANTFPSGAAGSLDLNGDAVVYNGTKIHTGNCAIYEVESGVYYYKGEYILADRQTLILSKYYNTPTYRIGYKVDYETVTTEADASLYDPASGFSNFTAPGADRRRANLMLSKIGDGTGLDTTPQKDFFEIAIIKDGRREWFVEFPDYSKIEETLARRTYDESGNYTVNPYVVTAEAKTNPHDPTFVLEVHPGGKSFIKGHEFWPNGMIKSRFVNVPKSIGSASEKITTPLYDPKNYILVYDAANTVNLSDPENANGMFDLQNNEVIYLHSQNKQIVSSYSLSTEATWNSTLVATARARAFAYDEVATRKCNEKANREQGKVYRLWIYDIKNHKVSGKVGQPNKMKVSTASVADGKTTFNFNKSKNGIHSYHVSDLYWHGFANSSPDPGGTLHGSFIKQLPLDGSTTGDTITVSGSSQPDEFSLRNVPILSSDDTSITVDGNYGGGATFDADVHDLYIQRSTGGYTSRRTIMLDANTGAQWNDSYVGGTITITNGPSEGESRKIIGYCGNSSVATTHQIGRYNLIATDHFVSEGAIGRPRLLVVDREFSEASNTSTEYEISVGLNMARSVIGQAAYTDGTASELDFDSALAPNLQWNIDTFGGISGSETTSDDDPINIRETGDTIFKSAGQPSMIHLGRDGIRSAQSWNAGDSSQNWGNTTFVTQRTYDVTLNGSGQKTSFVPASYDYTSPLYWDGTKEEFLPVDRGAGVLYDAEKASFWSVTDLTTGATINASFFTVDPDNTLGSKQVDFTAAAYANKLVRIVVPVRVNNARPKLKTLHKTDRTTFTSHKGSDAGHVHIRNASGINLATGGPSANVSGEEISLGIADVQNVAVFTSRSAGTLSDVKLADPGTYEVTHWFDLDNGQRNNYYDHASLKLRTDAPSDGFPGWQFVAFVDYWESDQTNRGFFAVDSYKHVTDLFHGRTAGADYSAQSFGIGEQVVGSKSRISGWVYDHQKDNASGDHTLRIVGMSKSGGNNHFIPGETVATGNNHAWIEISAGDSSRANADIAFDNIPKFTSSGGVITSLRNVLDFRPVRERENFSANSNHQVTVPLLSSYAAWGREYYSRSGEFLERNPMVFNTSVPSFYEGRVDSLVITERGEFKLRPGVPGVSPVPPRPSGVQLGNEMVLYYVKIPPYVTDVKKVSLKRLNNQRFTMKDIGRLEKRINQLEYHVALNALEKTTKDMSILDSHGLERFKNGILIDNFEGSSVVDVHNSDTRYNYSVDIKDQMLHPYQSTQHNREFKTDVLLSTGLIPHRQNSVSMLSYSNTSWIEQELATTPVSVNPFSMKSFNGTVRLSPDHDRWLDTSISPNPINIDLRASYDNVGVPGPDGTRIVGEIHGGVPNYTHSFALTEDYETHATGYHTPNRHDNGSYWNDSYHQESSAQNYTLNYGDFNQYTDTRMVMTAHDTSATIEGAVSSFAIVPYMRAKDIIVQAKGLKPNSKINAFFGDINVTRYMSRCNEIYVNNSTKIGTFSVEKGFNIPGVAEVDEYETVALKSTADHSIHGYASLIAIREYDGGTVAIISPLTSSDSGLVRDNGYVEGFYTSSTPDVRFNESGGAAYIQGLTSGATISLNNDSRPTSVGDTNFKKNGHFFGKIGGSNTEIISPSVQQGLGGWITLSSDADNYLANSFGYFPADGHANDAIAALCNINIVSGPGAGTQLQVDEFHPTPIHGGPPTAYCSTMPHNFDITDDNVPTAESYYHIVNTPSGREKNELTGSDIIGLPVPSGTTTFSNKHGEFFGMFHIPATDKTRFPNGRRDFTITNRGDNNPLFTSSFAHTEYHSEGDEHIKTDAIIATRASTTKLEQANRYELGNNPLSTGAVHGAEHNGLSTGGIFAIVHKIEVINGGSGWDPGTGLGRGDKVWGKVVHEGGTHDSQGYELQNIAVGGGSQTYNFPGVHFTGGNIEGVEAYCNVNAAGKISEVIITQPGGAFLTGGSDAVAPIVGVVGSAYHSKKIGTMGHGEIALRAHTTTDPEIISYSLGIMAGGSAGGTYTAQQQMAMAMQESTEYSDPIAQSFTVLGDTSADTQDGVFITGVDVFFQQKPDPVLGDAELPVTVDLRTMINGQPSAEILPVGGGSYAIATLLPNEVTVADADSTKTNIVPSMQFSNTWTSFMFDAPAYLMPGKQYAFVVTSNSDKYYVWTAKSGELVVGSGSTGASIPIGGDTDPVIATTSNKVGGTMFKAEQAGAPLSPWTIDSESDMMFRLRRANFVSSGSIRLAAGENVTSDIPIHGFKVNVVDAAPRNTSVQYKYRAADLAGNLPGFKKFQDNVSYQNLKESLAFKNKTYNTNAYKNFGSFQIDAIVETDNPFVSPVIDTSQFNVNYFGYKINNGGLNTSGIDIKKPGTGYQVNDKFTTSGGGGTGAIINVDSVASGAITGVSIDAAGSGYHSTPTLIDSGTGSGAELFYGGETESSGGNADVRYITRRINLRDGLDAKDLRVFLTAHKPRGTEVHVYYKVHSEYDLESFEDKKWVRMILDGENRFDQSLPEQPYSQIEMSEYQYETPSESEIITYINSDGSSYDTFKSYAIKIVMFSDEFHKHPVVRDMRAIALT